MEPVAAGEARYDETFASKNKCTSLRVPCLTEAIKFYSFGFELVDHEHLAPSDEADRVTQLQGTDTTVAMLRAGNLFIEQFHSPAPKALNRRLNDFGITHFSFEVESVHEAYINSRLMRGMDTS